MLSFRRYMQPVMVHARGEAKARGDNWMPDPSGKQNCLMIDIWLNGRVKIGVIASYYTGGRSRGFALTIGDQRGLGVSKSMEAVLKKLPSILGEKVIEETF